MQRAGNRRYYRPADVELAHRIHRLLNQDGYTVRGVQKLLRDKEAQAVDVATAAARAGPAAAPSSRDASSRRRRVPADRAAQPPLDALDR